MLMMLLKMLRSVRITRLSLKRLLLPYRNHQICMDSQVDRGHILMRLDLEFSIGTVVHQICLLWASQQFTKDIKIHSSCNHKLQLPLLEAMPHLNQVWLTRVQMIICKQLNGLIIYRFMKQINLRSSKVVEIYQDTKHRVR